MLILGVFEPLNETQYDAGLVVRGTHFLFVSGITNAIQLTRSLGQELYKQPQISFMETSQSFAEWSTNFKTQVIHPNCLRIKYLYFILFTVSCIRHFHSLLLLVINMRH